MLCCGVHECPLQALPVAWRPHTGSSCWLVIDRRLRFVDCSTTTLRSSASNPLLSLDGICISQNPIATILASDSTATLRIRRPPFHLVAICSLNHIAYVHCNSQDSVGQLIMLDMIKSSRAHQPHIESISYYVSATFSECYVLPDIIFAGSKVQLPKISRGPWEDIPEPTPFERPTGCMKGCHRIFHSILGFIAQHIAEPLAL